MTDFQTSAVSFAILLEVFSDDMLGDSSCSQQLEELRNRVAKGEFWDRIGGLDNLEISLREGFAETFKDPRTDNNGILVVLEFPESKIGVLFTELRNCTRSVGTVKGLAHSVLPILRDFVAGRFSPGVIA